MQQITPCLWFNNNAEEAVEFYISIFKDGKQGSISRDGNGLVITSGFTINGMEMIALNGGPAFNFTEAVSFIIHCKDQDEVDYYWERLSAGGNLQMCGWLKDKFGVSWQVVPVVLPKLMTGPNADKVMQVLLKMKKLEIAVLENAAAGNYENSN